MERAREREGERERAGAREKERWDESFGGEENEWMLFRASLCF